MSEQFHLVVGAGPIGSAVVRQLVASGERVRVVTRSGSGPDLPLAEKVAADAADRTRLTALAAGVTAIYNCVNPAYHLWATDWPPVAAALLAGVATPKVGRVPGVMLAAMGLFNPGIRELPEVAYQLNAPFLMDSSAAQNEFGLVPMPADDVLRAILVPYLVQSRTAA